MSNECEPVGTPEKLRDLGGSKNKPIAMVMRRRRREWFGHVKRRDETENIQAVVEMNMDGNCPKGRPRLYWKDAVRRVLKAWNIKKNWPLTGNNGKVSARPATRTGKRWQTVAKGEKRVCTNIQSTSSVKLSRL